MDLKTARRITTRHKSRKTHLRMRVQVRDSFYVDLCTTKTGATIEKRVNRFHRRRT